MRDHDFIINSSRIPELRESTIEWYKIHAPLVELVEPERIKTGVAGFDGLVSNVNRINAA